MKQKTLLIAICLMLLLVTPVMAQTPNVGSFMFAGVSVDAKGYGTDVVQSSFLVGLSSRVFLLADGTVDKLLDAGAGLKAWGGGGEILYVLNDWATISGGVWLTRTEKDDELPWYSKVGASFAFYPKFDLLKADGEKWGILLGVAYKPATEQLLISAGPCIFFGK